METVTLDLYNNGIILETDVDGYVVGRVNIPSGYVSLTQKALLGEHYIVPGDKLRNGMIVLLEDGRVDPDIISPENPQRTLGFGLRAGSSANNRNRVEVTSRWALVTQLDIEIDEENNERRVSFVAIYADGTMKYREERVEVRWIMQMKTDLVPVCANCGLAVEDHESGPDAPSLDPEAALVDLLGEDVFSTIKGIIKERLFGKTDVVDDESRSVFNSDVVKDALKETSIPPASQQAIFENLFYANPESDAADIDPRD